MPRAQRAGCLPSLLPGDPLHSTLNTPSWPLHVLATFQSNLGWKALEAGSRVQCVGRAKDGMGVSKGPPTPQLRTPPSTSQGPTVVHDTHSPKGHREQARIAQMQRHIRERKKGRTPREPLLCAFHCEDSANTSFILQRSHHLFLTTGQQGGHHKHHSYGRRNRGSEKVSDLLKVTQQMCCRARLDLWPNV